VTAAWRGLVNQVTYGVDLANAVDDDTVARVADALVAQRVYPHPVPEYHDAVVAALSSTERVAPEDGGDDRLAREFLTRLLQQLDERRPWPDSAFAQLDVSSWPEVASAPVVGRVPWRRREVGARLNRAFADIDDGGSPVKAMILRLRTGHVVGLRMSAQAREPGAAVLSHDDAPATLAALRELTGMPVEPVDPGPARSVAG
jgi:hypothetical protein